MIYIGRLEPHKRVDQLIKKVKNIPEFNLEVIGSGSLENQVQSLARDANNINFLGNLGREEMIDHLAKSWIFVMPSYREGFSIASLEAMAASVPMTSKLNSGMFFTFFMSWSTLLCGSRRPI